MKLDLDNEFNNQTRDFHQIEYNRNDFFITLVKDLVIVAITEELIFSFTKNLSFI